MPSSSYKQNFQTWVNFPQVPYYWNRWIIMYPIKGIQKYIQCNLHPYLYEETLVITLNTQHLYFSFIT